ncbi:MAG: ubiquinol-cytochrome c reductase iron-sulfur subunit [Gemmatimonadetes bacterium]|nr:ubiquinol-cytochrome c reductase iron-sulfur subunit [Gemmatimonadota bacterium]
MRRREFVGIAAGALSASALPGCATFVAAPVTPVNGEIRLALRNHPQLERRGGYLKIRPVGTETRLYVVTADRGRYSVVSPICTHLACTVNVEGTQIRCPCHGSTFDLEGNVLQGPATQPLRRYPVSVTADGELIIRYAEGA